MQWDKTLTRIVEQIAEEEGVRVTKVKDAVNIFFRLVRRELEKFGGVLIHNFGKFYPNHDILYYKLKNIIKRYRKENDQERFEKEFTQWHRVLESARKHYPRKPVKKRG